MISDSPIHTGIWPVMLTPFRNSGRIDWNAYEKLIDYYIEEGVAGIFAVCTSSEFFNLERSEIIDLARRSVVLAHGRISVVATGNFGESIEEQIDMIRRIAETGVDATIIATSLLPDNLHLVDQMMEIAENTDAALGIYESPIPEHRTLTPNDVKEIARTGRFLALKETSRDLSIFSEKVKLCSDTPLKVFQANLRIFLNAGNCYGAGFMGCLANTFPGLIRYYIKCLNNPGSNPKHIRNIMLEMEAILNRNRYPASAKYLLNHLGIPIGTHCRWNSGGDFSDANGEDLNRFFEEIKAFLLTSNGTMKLCESKIDFIDIHSDIPEITTEPVID